MLSLPSTTAPASLSRVTTVASATGTESARIFEPAVVFTPAVLKRSFNPSGTPCYGPRSRPAICSASAWRAASSAASAHTVMKDLSAVSRAVMRSRWARVTSTGDTSLVAIMRARSRSDVQHNSAMSQHPVLRGGLDIAQRKLLEPRQRLEGPGHDAAQPFHIGLAPVESGKPRLLPEQLGSDLGHARQDTQARPHRARPGRAL